MQYGTKTDSRGKEKTVLSFSKYTAYHTTGQWWLTEDRFLLFLYSANEVKVVVCVGSMSGCERPHTIYMFTDNGWAILGVYTKDRNVGEDSHIKTVTR